MRDQLENVTLLLVDDDDVDVMTIERSIHKQKLHNPIVRAHDGLEALELLKNGSVTQPYIILLDLQMPRMNGFEFIEALKNDPELTDSVIFILTTSNDRKDLAASYEKHVAGYFVKDAAGPYFINIIEILDTYREKAQRPSV